MHSMHLRPTLCMAHLLVLLYKAEKPSVRLHFLSRGNLGCLCMDRSSAEHTSATYQHAAVLVFAIIFGHVKFSNLCRFT